MTLGLTSFGRSATAALLLLQPLVAEAADRPLVAVIDSGVARTAELGGVLVGEHDLAARGRPAFQPRYDHGTWVATILHRAARGGVDIVSLRIDDPAGCPATATPPCQSSSAPIAAAIRKAVALKADAINISLTVPRSRAVDAAVREAAAAGVPVVLAAGNKGADHPANLSLAMAGYPEAVLVGAVDRRGEPWPRSNRPDARSGVAYNFTWNRGVRMPTAGADGAPVLASGTSFAAPVETARLALDQGASRSLD